MGRTASHVVKASDVLVFGEELGGTLLLEDISLLAFLAHLARTAAKSDPISASYVPSPCRGLLSCDTRLIYQ